MTRAVVPRLTMSPLVRRFSLGNPLVGLAVLSALVWVAGAAKGQEAISCILRPVHEIEIAPPVAGLLEVMVVDRGDPVIAGQELGRLQAKVEEAQLAAARQRAASTAAIDARRAQLAEAERRLAQIEALTNRAVATRSQLDEITAETQVARAQLAEAEDAQLAARLEVEAAEAAVNLRIIHAPVSGLVLTRHVDPGEYAAADEALLDIVTVDTLLAEALLPAEAKRHVREGQSVMVHSEDGALQRPGVIDAVDPVIDAASRSFGLRIRLENEDGAFTAGNRCAVAF